jgi:hypothetical protein
VTSAAITDVAVPPDSASTVKRSRVEAPSSVRIAEAATPEYPAANDGVSPPPSAVNRMS